MPESAQPAGRVVASPSLLDALVPLASLALLIAGSLALFGLDALDGPIQVALVLACAVATLVAMRNGHTFTAVQEAGRGALASVTIAIFILLAVGALIGVWNLSGTIPTLVYYGIQILSPGWFYAAAALMCGAVAMSIGSSWTTAATLGVGLVGIAGLLDVSTAVTAGAVISGAYLGDKLSPLSETTILTSQIAGVEVHEHIKRQAWTSLPAFGIAFVVLLVLGLPRPATGGDAATTSDLAALGDVYRISAVTLLPVVLLGGPRRSSTSSPARSAWTRCASSTPAATSTSPSASSGTPATTPSPSNPASCSPTTATRSPTRSCARRGSRSSRSSAPSWAEAAAAGTA